MTIQTRAFSSGSVIETIQEQTPLLSRVNKRNHLNTNTNIDTDSDIDFDIDSPTPLPFLHTSLLCILLITEPLTASVSLPFIVFMVKSFNENFTDAQIGFYAGILASAFYAAQTFTSMIWSLAADNMSRRALFVISLFGTILSILAFGSSSSLSSAIIARLSLGAFNGIVGVARGSIRDITDTTNESRAYMFAGFSWGIGWILGPVCGGFLANPTTQLPKLFGNIEFLHTHPYILPCVVVSLPAILGIFIAGFLPCEVPPQDEEYEDEEYEDQDINQDHEIMDEMTQVGFISPIQSSLHRMKSTNSLRSREIHPMYSPSPIPSQQYPTDLTLSRTTTMLSGTPTRRQYSSNLVLPRSVTQSHRIRSVTSVYSTPTRKDVNQTGNNNLNLIRTSNSHSLFGSPVEGYGARRALLFGGRDFGEGYTESVVESEDTDLDDNNSENLENFFALEDGMRKRHRKKSLAERVFENNEDNVVNLADFYISKTEAEVVAQMEKLEIKSQKGISNIPENCNMISPSLCRYHSIASLRSIASIQEEQTLNIHCATTIPTLLIITYANLALHCTIFDQLYSTMLVSPAIMNDHTRGPGMGLLPMDFAKLISLMGFVQLFAQFWLYPKLQSIRIFITSLGPLGIYIFGSIIYLPTVIIFPFLRYIQPFDMIGNSSSQGQIGWIFLAILIATRFTASVLAYTPIMVMLNSPLFTPPEKLSFANGLAQSACSLARAIGPTLGGALYSWSLKGQGANIAGGPGFSGFYFVSLLICGGISCGIILIRRWMKAVADF